MCDYGAETLFSKEKNKDHVSKSDILKCNAALRAAPKPCIAFQNLAIQTQSIAKKKSGWVFTGLFGPRYA